MITIPDLISIEGHRSDAGVCKASRQIFISTDLPFERIKKQYDRVLLGEQCEYSEHTLYEPGPNASYLIKGPGASFEHRWQIEILRIDCEEALLDLESYLALELQNHVVQGSRYLICVFDNDLAYGSREQS